MPSESCKRCCIVGGVTTAVILVIVLVLTLALIGWDSKYGLSFEPNLDPDTALISYKHGIQGNWSRLYDRMEIFLMRYDAQETSPSAKTCNWNKLPHEDEVCQVFRKDMGWSCGREQNYGYPSGTPCIILYPHMRQEWVPEYYTPNELPEEMPNDVKLYITSQRVSTNPNQYTQMLETVWVSCEGEDYQDADNLMGVRYLPMPGFPGYYFPSRRNNPGYAEPFVAVQFSGPRRGVVISVRCNLWAKNIPSGEGVLRFKLRVD